MHPSDNRLTVIVSPFFYPCSLTKLSFLEDHRKYHLEHSYVHQEVELIPIPFLIAGGVKAIMLYAGRDATECVFSVSLFLRKLMLM